MGAALSGPSLFEEGEEYTTLTAERMAMLQRQGLNADLALVPAQMPRHDDDRIMAPAAEKAADRIKSPIALHTDSVQWKCCYDDVHVLTFVLDAEEACSVTVTYNAKNTSLAAEPVFVSASRIPTVTINVEQDLSQRIRLPESQGVHRSDVVSSIVESSIYSAVIHISTIHVQQYTLLTLPTDRSPRIEEQLLFISGSLFSVRDIYGAGDNPASPTCTICLTERASTVVLPCRHLCCCQTCAALLREQTTRCPMCRNQVYRLVHV